MFGWTPKSAKFWRVEIHPVITRPKMVQSKRPEHGQNPLDERFKPVMDDHGSLDLFEAVDRDRPSERGIDLDRPPQGQGRSWVRSEVESIFKRAKKVVYRGFYTYISQKSNERISGYMIASEKQVLNVT